jgi:hypothetical protein
MEKWEKTIGARSLALRHVNGYRAITLTYVSDINAPGVNWFGTASVFGERYND